MRKNAKNEKIRKILTKKLSPKKWYFLVVLYHFFSNWATEMSLSRKIMIYIPKESFVLVFYSHKLFTVFANCMRFRKLLKVGLYWRKKSKKSFFFNFWPHTECAWCVQILKFFQKCWELNITFQKSIYVPYFWPTCVNLWRCENFAFLKCQNTLILVKNSRKMRNFAFSHFKIYRSKVLNTCVFLKVFI